MCSCFIQEQKEVFIGICGVLLFQVDLLSQILSTLHPTIVFYVSQNNWNLLFRIVIVALVRPLKLNQDSLDAD